MKKLLLLLLPFIAVSACEAKEQNKTMFGVDEIRFNDISVNFFVDPMTRCHYIIIRKNTGHGGPSITPRLNKDGKPICDVNHYG